MKCGCKAEYNWLSDERRLVIVFCPMHEAAPEMLEALKAIKAGSEAVMKVNQILAKIEGA